MTKGSVYMRWAKEHGAVAVCMRPVEGNRLLVDPYFYPIYDEAERLWRVHGARGGDPTENGDEPSQGFPAVLSGMASPGRPIPGAGRAHSPA